MGSAVEFIGMSASHYGANAAAWTDRAGSDFRTTGPHARPKACNKPLIVIA